MRRRRIRAIRGPRRGSLCAQASVAAADAETCELGEKVAGVWVLDAFGSLGGHAGFVDGISEIAEPLGDPREIEPRPRERRVVGDDLLELVARVFEQPLLEQRDRESPAR